MVAEVVPPEVPDVRPSELPKSGTPQGGEVGAAALAEVGPPALPTIGPPAVPRPVPPEAPESRAPAVPDSPPSEVPKSSTAEPPDDGSARPRYLRLERKDVLFESAQVVGLYMAVRRLQHARRKKPGERITENTLVRVAARVLLDHADALSGITEDELTASLYAAILGGAK